MVQSIGVEPNPNAMDSISIETVSDDVGIIIIPRFKIHPRWSLKWFEVEYTSQRPDSGTTTGTRYLPPPAGDEYTADECESYTHEFIDRETIWGPWTRIVTKITAIMMHSETGYLLRQEDDLITIDGNLIVDR